MILSPTCHRILLALADAGRPVKVRDLGRMVDRSFGQVGDELRRLHRTGLVETGPPGSCAGYWLRPGVAVARRLPRAGIVQPVQVPPGF